MAARNTRKIAQQLAAENEELRLRLAEAEDTIRALGAGEVDAFVIHGPAGPRVFTLQGAEQPYRIIVETMSEGAVTTAQDGTILYGNNALSRMLRLPLPLIVGRRLQELVLDPYHQQLAKLLAQARSGPARERLLLRAAEGRDPRPAYFSAAPLPREEGEPHICMVLTDLGELESAAAELHASREREKVLAASEERFRVFAEAVPNIIWTADPDGRVDFTNKRWTEYSGLAAPAGLGLGWEIILHPDDRERTAAAWQQAMTTGNLYQIEHRLRRADGEYRWHLSRALPLWGEHGRISRWYGTSTDITEAKQRQEDLQKLTEQLTQSNQALKEFAYIASHDLQEPLRVITGFLDLLKRRYRGRLDAQADEFIDFAVDGAARMHNLIYDLLNYSRVGSSEVNLKTVAVDRIVDQALANLKMSIEETGARISRTPLPLVKGDEMLLVQLFQNLLSNGLKFHGEEPPDIRIAAEQLDDEWRFAIQDRGIGLEPRQARRIFQIFQRLHSAGKYKGTGIGLAICKKIVERHSGRIWVESQPGAGATFYFTLPRNGSEGERK